VLTTSVSALSSAFISLPSPAEYYIQVDVYDQLGIPVTTDTVDGLYVPSCDGIETESATLIESEDNMVIQLELTDVVYFDGVCLSLESDMNDCLLTEQSVPIEPEGFYPNWLLRA